MPRLKQESFRLESSGPVREWLDSQDNRTQSLNAALYYIAQEFGSNVDFLKALSKQHLSEQKWYRELAHEQVKYASKLQAQELIRKEQQLATNSTPQAPTQPTATPTQPTTAPQQQAVTNQQSGQFPPQSTAPQPQPLSNPTGIPTQDADFDEPVDLSGLSTHQGPNQYQ